MHMILWMKIRGKINKRFHRYLHKLMEETKHYFGPNVEKLGIALYALEHSFHAAAKKFRVDRKSVKERSWFSLTDNGNWAAVHDLWNRGWTNFRVFNAWIKFAKNLSNGFIHYALIKFFENILQKINLRSEGKIVTVDCIINCFS